MVPLPNALSDSIPQISPQISVVGYPLEDLSLSGSLLHSVTSSACASTERKSNSWSWRLVRHQGHICQQTSRFGLSGMYVLGLEQDTEPALVILFYLFYVGEDGLELLGLLLPPSRAAITDVCRGALFTWCWGWNLGLCTC